MTPVQAAFICSKACDTIAEDTFSVASQHFIGLIHIKWGTFMRPLSRCVTWYVGEMPPADVPTAKRSGRPEPRQPLEYQVGLKVCAGFWPWIKQEDTFLSKKSGVTSVISRDARRSNTSCLLACCLVDFFWWTLQLQWFFIEAVPLCKGDLSERALKVAWDRRWKQIFVAVRAF